MKNKVWSEFQYTKKDGTVLQFTVLDCPKDRIDDVIDVYKKYFIRDESLQKLSGITTNEEAVQECTILYGEMLKDEDLHITICIENSTDAVVGVSSMQLAKAVYEDPDITLQTKEVAKLFEILDGMKNMYDVPTNYSVDKYYDGRGIIVHPDYRGFGIGGELVKLRKNICKEHGLAVTSAWMTAIGTQKAAERDGWETPFEIDSHEFAQKFKATPYEGIPPTFKVMVKKVS